MKINLIIVAALVALVLPFSVSAQGIMNFSGAGTAYGIM